MQEKEKWYQKISKSLKISKNKTLEIGKIATIKSEIYLDELKINHIYKTLGEKFYKLLKEGKEINEILRLIQPCINDIEKIEEKINIQKEKIKSLKREIKLSERESSVIDEIDSKNRKS